MELVPKMRVDSPSLNHSRTTFAEVAPGGADRWPAFLDKTVALWQSGPHIALEQLGTVGAPTLVISGDDDLVELEHTTDLYRALPKGQLAVVPGASHLVPMERPLLLDDLLAAFIDNDTPHELMPMRRKGR